MFSHLGPSFGVAAVVEVHAVKVETVTLRIEVLAVNELDRVRHGVAETLTEATEPLPFLVGVGGPSGRQKDGDSPVVFRQQATELHDVLDGKIPHTLSASAPLPEIPVVPTDVQDDG